MLIGDVAAFQYSFTGAQILAPAVVALFAVASWLPWAVLAGASAVGVVAIGRVAGRLPRRALGDA